MLNKEQIYQIIDFVVNEAKGYDTSVLVVSQQEGLTRFANSEIHQNVFEDRTTVTVTVFSGKKKSTIETTLYSEAGLKSAVQDAITNLDFLPEGEIAIPLTDTPQRIEEDCINPRLAQDFDIPHRAALVREGLALLESGYIGFGALSLSTMTMAYGNSTGVKRYNHGNAVDFSVLISHESGGSGYAELTSNRTEELDIISGFKVAYEKARMNQNPVQLEPGTYTVILEPLAIGEMLTYMAYTGFSGKAINDRYSFLTGKQGEKVFDERVTIIDDCANPNTLPFPFDFEGVQRKVVTIVENGVVKDAVYDKLSAIKAGVESTGHSINHPDMGGMTLNLVLSNGDKSLAELVKGTDNGLLVTRFHYMNVVTPRQAVLTALTRDGVFKIENGEIVGAVKNMRFTESMLEAFNNIDELSKERQRVKSFFGNFYVPSIKINNFHLTGKTNT